MSRILIVDDSSFARNNLRKVLAGTGHEVTQADSGAAAINMAKTLAPDLVTLDLLMPGLSGKETLVQLIKICPDTKYIIITADIQDATQRELLSCGANAFLNKPVNATALITTVQKLLEGVG